MSAVANIVLADALATPVNHTFVPVGQDQNGVWWFDDQSQASPIGYWRISIDFRRPPIATVGEQGTRVYKGLIGLHEPSLETVSNNTVSGIAPAPTLSYICRSKQEFFLPERSTPQNRKDLRKMSSNLLNDALVIDMIENLRPVY